MLEFFKKLFGIEDKSCCKYHCCCDGPNDKEITNAVINRKEYSIILPNDIKAELEAENISISATKYKGKPSCVQMFKTIDGKCEYLGTLKARMSVKSFKDGNVCNFSRENLIYREEK